MMATPLRLQRSDALEQPLDLAIGQRRRRLVHDEDARVLRQRLGNLDHLLLRDAELVHERAGIEVEAERVEQPPRVGVHAPMIDGAGKAATRLAAEEDVLRDVEVRDERELLEDDRDARARRASAGERSCTGAPSTRISPASG